MKSDQEEKHQREGSRS